MEFSARQIADILQGSVVGDENALVTDLSKIDEGKPNTLTFLANPAYTDFIYSTKASVAIVSHDFNSDKPLPKSLTLVKVADARLAFAKVLEAYSGALKPTPGIHPTAAVHASAKVDKTAYIGAHSVIDAGAEIGQNVEIHSHSILGAMVKIGDGTIVHSNCYIGTRCLVGKNCILQPGAIIGSDGFGFAPNSENQYQKVVHVGNVILEDHVEIGANTTIDRATIGSTKIKKGVKLDNLIQVAHNVEIGENTVIAAQTGIAGSTKIGKNCMIGGQVGIVGHITIADEVKIAAQSGVGKSITQKGSILQGSPAMPIGDFKRSYVFFRKLHSMAEDIFQLQKNLPKLDNNG